MKRTKAFYILVAITFIFVLIQVSCIDPYDYDPDYPDLADPPPPPVLLYPLMNENIESATLPCIIGLEWLSVSGAGSYRVETTCDSGVVEGFDNITGENYDYQVFSYGKYYWRVRADSRAWKWYTEWSEIHAFTIVSP